MARKKISKRARGEWVAAIGERYRAGNRPEKLRILDEFVAVTAYHREHAIGLLNSAGARQRSRKPSLSRVYDDAVQEALVVLWEASDRVCGKRLKPLLPILLAALARHGHLQLDEAVSAKGFSVKSSTRAHSPTDSCGRCSGGLRNGVPLPPGGSCSPAR